MLAGKTQHRKESRHRKVIQYIGLDVHNDSIAISIAPSDSTEVRRWGIIGGTHAHVQRFIKQIQAAHSEATLKFCSEAGPRGFPLARFIRGLGHECIIVCPSRVPRRPGDRVKTDRRDADQLARLHRAGGRLQLEWIARGLTAKSFWTARRRWIAALEGECGLASRRETAPGPTESQ